MLTEATKSIKKITIQHKNSKTVKEFFPNTASV